MRGSSCTVVFRPFRIESFGGRSEISLKWDYCTYRVTAIVYASKIETAIRLYGFVITFEIALMPYVIAIKFNVSIWQLNSLFVFYIIIHVIMLQHYYYISLPYAVAAIKILCIITAELCSCYYFYRRRHHHRRQYYCAFMSHTCPDITSIIIYLKLFLF